MERAVRDASSPPVRPSTESLPQPLDSLPKPPSPPTSQSSSESPPLSQTEVDIIIPPPPIPDSPSPPPTLASSEPADTQQQQESVEVKESSEGSTDRSDNDSPNISLTVSEVIIQN